MKPSDIAKSIQEQSEEAGRQLQVAKAAYRNNPEVLEALIAAQTHFYTIRGSTAVIQRILTAAASSTGTVEKRE